MKEGNVHLAVFMDVVAVAPQFKGSKEFLDSDKSVQVKRVRFQL